MRGTLAGSLVVAVVALSCANDTEIQREPAVGDGETGEVWTGTMHTDTFYGDRLDFCNGTADATLRLIVAADGTVTGEAELTGPEEECEATSSTGTISFDGPGTNLTDFGVTGTKTPTEFRFTFVQRYRAGETFASGLVPTLVLEHVIPITGSTVAEGEYQLSSGPGTRTENVVRLDCESCEEGAG
jgi:hypothetical protein